MTNLVLQMMNLHSKLWIAQDLWAVSRDQVSKNDEFCIKKRGIVYQKRIKTYKKRGILHSKWEMLCTVCHAGAGVAYRRVGADDFTRSDDGGLRRWAAVRAAGHGREGPVAPVRHRARETADGSAAADRPQRLELGARRRGCRTVSKNEELCIKMMNFVSKTRRFVFKMMNFAGKLSWNGTHGNRWVKMMNCALKTRNFVSKRWFFSQKRGILYQKRWFLYQKRWIQATKEAEAERLQKQSKSKTGTGVEDWRFKQEEINRWIL